MKKTNSSTVKQQACEWIAKLHENELSPSERGELKAWAAQSDEHKSELSRMAKQWEELNSLTLLAMPGDHAKLERKGFLHYFSSVKLQLAAAAVAAVALLVVMVSPHIPSEQSAAPELLSYATDIGEQRLITLPDNSTVLLNTKSRFSIAYSPEYRDIYLIEGEAHFDVMSNAERPFRVFAGKGRVRAVGTAFSVYLKKATVDVTVTHGSVAINPILDAASDVTSLQGQSKLDPELVVKAGHAAQFDQLAGTVETIELSESAKVPAWHQGKLRFSGERLEHVVEEISRYSPLSIVVLDSEIRDLRVGGLFNVGETKRILKALETGFGVKVSYINENLVHLTAGDAEVR